MYMEFIRVKVKEKNVEIEGAGQWTLVIDVGRSMQKLMHKHVETFTCAISFNKEYYSVKKN